jgi:hypothetical protein
LGLGLEVLRKSQDQTSGVPVLQVTEPGKMSINFKYNVIMLHFVSDSSFPK